MLIIWAIAKLTPIGGIVVLSLLRFLWIPDCSIGLLIDSCTGGRIDRRTGQGCPAICAIPTALLRAVRQIARAGTASFSTIVGCDAIGNQADCIASCARAGTDGGTQLWPLSSLSPVSQRYENP